MTDLLAEGFRALGRGPNPREVRLVAAALLDAKDRSTLRRLDAAVAGDTGMHELYEVARGAGSVPIVALDLATAYSAAREER